MVPEIRGGALLQKLCYKRGIIITNGCDEFSFHKKSGEKMKLFTYNKVLINLQHLNFIDK